MTPNNEYIVKDSFNLVTKTDEQDSSNFMGNLDIDSIFTKILLEETIQICTKKSF